MKLIFLDIDGVLNNHEPLHPEVMCGQIHPDKVRLFNEILERTGAHYVLSSAWRYLVHRGEMNRTGLGWLMRSHGIRDRLVGITCRDEEIPIRGAQISEFMRTSIGMIGVEIEKYVVLDDLDLGISEAGHPFIHVEQGLLFSHVLRAIEILGEKS